MNQVVEQMSDAELLGLIVGGRVAAKMLKAARGSLASVFNDSMGTDAGIPTQRPKLLAARELVRRSLAEVMRQRDVLTSPASVRDYLRLTIAQREHEVFTIVFLDAQNRVLGIEEMFRGTLTQTSVYPREVVKQSLAHNAAAVIFAHNHPSGVAEPSYADETLTRALKQALALVDVKVLDHFVVTGNHSVSFSERGLI